MQLPRSLTPWTPLLSLFPREVAQTLGATILRLAPSIGPLLQKSAIGAEEPDGYSGTTPRGPYERLLMSEWLLAEELPEEFLRRVCMHEQSFLKLDLKQPCSANASILLLDEGPSQLGAPRLAHLALLVIFAMRAARAQADFFWGVLQSPEDGLRQGVSIELLHEFLKQRSVHYVSESHFSVWANVLNTEAPKRDLWLIYGNSIDDKLSPSGKISIKDPLALATRSLQISVEKPHANRSIILDLPDADICTRILRDPFSTKEEIHATTNLLAPDSEMVFANSRKLAVQLADGSGVAIYPVPNSAHAKPGRARTFNPPEGEWVAAIIKVGKKLLPITSDGNRITFHRFPSLDDNQVTLSQNIFRSNDEPIAEAFVVIDHGHRAIYFTNSKQVLYSLKLETHNHVFERLASDVIAFGRSANNVWFMTSAKNSAWATLKCVNSSNGEAQQVELFSVDEKRPAQAYFGNMFQWWGVAASSSIALMAIRTEAGHWMLRQGSSTFTIDQPDDVEIVGVTLVHSHLLQVRTPFANQPASGERIDKNLYPALVGLHKDRRAIQLLGTVGNTSLPTHGTIQSVRLHAAHPHLAYLTSNREIWVLNLKNGEELLHIGAERI